MRISKLNLSSAKQKKIIMQVLIVGLTTVGAIIVLIPVILMINASIHPIKEILSYPPKFIPEKLTFEYIERIFYDGQQQQYFFNSCILSFSTLILTLTLSILAAYGFSRYKLRGSSVMLLGILSLLMLPPVVLIIPYFRIAHITRLFDTIFILIIVNTAFTIPISTWLLKGYIDTIPVALEEAAWIDGYNRFQTIRKILIPAMAPGIVGTGTYVFILTWNEYLLAVTLTDTPDRQPLTVGLASFFGQYVRDWNSIMSLTVIASLPLMVLFIIFQRWVVQGMTSGAVK